MDAAFVHSRQPCPPCTSYGHLQSHGQRSACSAGRSLRCQAAREGQALPAALRRLQCRVLNTRIPRASSVPLQQDLPAEPPPPHQPSTAAPTGHAAAPGQAPAAPVHPAMPSQQPQPSASANNLNGTSTSSLDGSDQQQPAAPAPAAKTAAQKAKEFANRVVFGVLLGLAGAGVILYGKQAVLAVVVLVTYQATQEYYGFITSKQMSAGMTPPPPFVSAATTVLCISMAFISYFYKGKSGTVLAVASFLLLVMDVVTIKRPKFSQLASSLFGLFYCGWLPSFWLKLRLLSSPAPEVAFVGALSGFTQWTIGLVATFTAVACIIAADTGAYFVGKSLGRTKLTDISPKKTVEGAIGGMAASVLVALGSWKLCAWPATPLAAVGLGVVIFFSSLFGDLIESIMKRDAGMKDSGDLIPGHGGLLDRFDSYIFSGAVVYFYTCFMLPIICP